MQTEILLHVKNLRKECSGDALDYVPINDITFDLTEHSFSSILAPQFSKKNLLLELIAGIEKPTSGIIESKGNNIVYIPPLPSSFPWMNVRGNIQLGTRYNKTGKTTEIQELVDLVGLHGYEEHFPNNKSLGFRFRVSLARALAADAKLLLIGQPFDKMDSITKSEMYILIRKIFESTGISILLVTSNVSEAVFLSDKVIISKPDYSGIIYEMNISLPEPRSLRLFADDAFKVKVKEIEDLIKKNEALAYSSFLI